MAKQYYLIISILFLAILGTTIFYNNSPQTSDDNIIFQVSTLNSLSAGNFDGNFSISELKKHGDTGIGTFNGLDGEMIELNGNVYQVKSNGTVYLASGSTKTPFAMVTFFKPDKILFINSSMNYTELQEYLNATLPSKNMFYSFKVIGTFDSVKARSPPKQNKPYSNLTTALKNQSIFNFNNITGTMVGFWCPQSASDVNLNDYHFHFISADKSSGGHVLDLKLKAVIVEIDYIPDLYVTFPQNGGFLKINSS